jgi:AcrR family transcriptional regulator
MANAAGKRPPETVKAALIQAVVDGASRYGFAEVSVQEIAALAGVSKGGLFHYFSSRQELVDAAFNQCINDFDHAINCYMQDDNTKYGRFARAYVRATIDACIAGSDTRASFAFSALTNKRYIAFWRSWVLAKLKKYPAERDSPILRVARSAADGLWLQSYGTLLSKQEQAVAIEIRTRLIALSN